MTAAGKSSPKADPASARWIDIGAELDGILVGTRKCRVAEILQAASQRYDLAPRTLQNIVKAFRYTNSHAKSAGMNVADVRAAAMSIDVLMRVQRKSPSLAATIRRSVFSGEYSYREMIQIEKDVDRKRGIHVFKQIDWDVFAQEFVSEFFPGGEFGYLFGPERRPYSHIANLLGVDLELFHKNRTGCLFITPRVVFSAHRGQELEQQIPKVLASVGFYDTVTYLLWDANEVTAFKKFVEKSRTGAFDGVRPLRRCDVAAYICFGDDVLAPSEIGEDVC